ncbi:hypothetical protein Fmac_022956 [Flemingia macrophylla]|uniref:DUF674 domain-containing protein n=1 Tax=Flemingia macrophylla TaxID=520843 RepID=A0ABD1LKP5_9FABA
MASSSVTKTALACNLNTASTSTQLTLKLLIDSKQAKVLFAEASKEVIDFLFSLLCLPLSTVIRLLNNKGMVGSLGNLYQSVENLSDTYMQPNSSKDVLLKPRAPETSALLISSNDVAANGNIQNSVYTCPNRCASFVTCDKKTLCLHCRKPMSSEMKHVGDNVAGNVFSNKNINGYVKEVVTYMIMDDLVIQPMSAISSITLLNKFCIKEVGVLQEKVVELGVDQGVSILEASLRSKTVLTSVFLKKAA